MRPILPQVLCAAVLLAGCDTQRVAPLDKAEVTLPARLLPAAKADGSDGQRYVERLEIGGEYVVDFLYSRGDREIVFDLALDEGQTVDIAVHGESVDADPVAALYADSGPEGALELVAQNDDADETTLDSFVEWRAPRGGLQLFLVVTDYFEQDAIYRIHVSTRTEPWDPATLEAALEVLVAELTQAIADVEDEIFRLEADLSAKVQEIDRLVRDIERRKDEIEDAQTLKLMASVAGIFFGLPIVAGVSLVAAINDDSRIKSLSAQLDRARSDRSHIEALLRDYRAHRATLQQKLAALRADEEGLRRAAEPRELTPEEQAVFAELPEVPTTSLRIAALAALADNLTQQYDALVAIRDRLQSVAAVIDVVLDRMLVTESKARELADESREELFDLIELLVSPYPEAAAATWLEGLVKDKLIAVFGTLPTPENITSQLIEGFADRITARLFDDPSHPLAQSFRAELVRVIRG
jgi:hypothetical protein